MEIDIGNLVYIVFVAIIILVNLFTKKKKPGQIGQPPPNNQEEENEGPVRRDARKTFEELLEEFTNPQPAAAPAPAPAPKPKPKPVAQPTYQAQPVRTSQPKPKKEHSVMKTEYARFDEFKKRQGKSGKYGDAFRDLDSAKRAFIYSEIFKKKY